MQVLNTYSEKRMRKSDLTGILLAGGKSQRLGVNKALIEIKGKRLAEYPIGLLEKYCSEILISTNGPLPFTHKQIADVFKDQGPMIGVYSCLLHSATTYNIVLSCDMPFINEGLIESMIEKIESDKIIVPVHDNGLIEPLCAIYPTSCRAAMEKYIQNQQLTLHEFISSSAHIDYKILGKMSFWNNQLFANINTPEDLEKIS
jgi:molybdenum cofactor guanylyltransferase